MASAASAFPLNAPQDCLMPLLERVLSQSLGPSRGEVAKKYEPFKYRSSQPRKISKLNKLNAQFSHRNLCSSSQKVQKERCLPDSHQHLAICVFHLCIVYGCFLLPTHQEGHPDCLHPFKLILVLGLDILWNILTAHSAHLKVPEIPSNSQNDAKKTWSNPAIWEQYPKLS